MPHHGPGLLVENPGERPQRGRREQVGATDFSLDQTPRSTWEFGQIDLTLLGRASIQLVRRLTFDATFDRKNWQLKNDGADAYNHPGEDVFWMVRTLENTAVVHHRPEKGKLLL